LTGVALAEPVAGAGWGGRAERRAARERCCSQRALTSARSYRCATPHPASP